MRRNRNLIAFILFAVALFFFVVVFTSRQTTVPKPDAECQSPGILQQLSADNINNLQPLCVFSANGWRSNVAFSPDSQLLASAPADFATSTTERIALWNVNSGQVESGMDYQIDTLGNVNTVAFDPLGRYIATGHQDGVTRLWDIQTGKNIVSFESNSSAIRAISFDPSGAFIISGSTDSNIYIWEIQNQKLKTILSGHTAIVSSLSLYEAFLVSGSDDKSVRLWNWKTGEFLSSLQDRNSRILGVSFNPNGNIIAAIEENGVKLWNLEDKTEINSWTDNNSENSSLINKPRVCFNVDGTMLLYVDNSLKAQWIDIKTGMRKTLFDGVMSMSCSPDHRLLALANANSVTIYGVLK